MRTNPFLIAAAGAFLFAGPSVFAYDFGQVPSKCASMKPTLCHTDLIDSETQTVMKADSFVPYQKRATSVRRQTWTGYYVDHATKSLIYIKIAEQKDSSLCYAPTLNGFEISNAGNPPNSAPKECQSEMASIGIYKNPSDPKSNAKVADKTAGTGGGSGKDKTETGNSQVADAQAGVTDGTKTNANATGSKTATPSENETISEWRQMRDEGKTQVDTVTGSDGTVTKKSYTDANGNHKLDDDENVTSTTIGRMEGSRFVATETITSGDVTKNSDTVTLKDASGNTHTFYNTTDAQKFANANGIDNAKFTKDGKTYKIDPKTGELIADRDAKSKNANKSEEQIKAEAKNATDPCSESLRLVVQRNHGDYNASEVKNFRCQGTQSWVKGAEVANQVLGGAGRAVVNTMGATAAQNASQGGTLIDAQEASAKMAKTSFTYETALGVANLAATAKLAAAANKHKANVGKLQAWKESQKGGNAYSGEDFETAAASKAQYNEAIKEQNGARNLASMAAMKTALTAAQSAAAAIVAKNNQKAAEKNAALARKAAQTLSDGALGYDPNMLAPPQQAPQYDPNALAATGSGDAGAATTTTDNLDPNAPGGAMLGDGNDLSGGDDSLNAPKAGAFSEGATAGGAGAAAGAPAVGASGAAMGGAPAAQDETKAAYASEFGTKERYESGGGMGYAPKAGGAAGGKGADGGIDLNGLLAQFLPKADDESSKHSILDSVAFGGNRHIATEEPASYLDKNADLFQRIHETMSEKNRRGQLGI